MTHKIILCIGLVLCLSWGEECPNGYIAINEYCYYNNHLNVLQDFVDINQSLNGSNPYEIGYQEWEDGMEGDGWTFGTVETVVTFSEPGSYNLRAFVSDAMLISKANIAITVTE